MKVNRKITFNSRIVGFFAAMVMAWIFLTASPAANAQAAAVNLSPDLQQIVKLAQAHMSDDVILSFVKGSGKTYTLSADDMVYLSSQGVSQAVLSVLMQPQGAAPGIPPVSAPPASAPPAYSPGPAPAPLYPAPAPAPAYLCLRCFPSVRPACKCRGSVDRASLPQFSPWASMRPRFPSLRPFPAWRREESHLRSIWSARICGNG